MATTLFNKIYEIILKIPKGKDKMAADPSLIEVQLQRMVSDTALEPAKSQLAQVYPE